MIKLLRICDHWSTDPPGLHFERTALQGSILASKAPEFLFNADPDPAFHFNADPDPGPASKNNTDPGPDPASKNNADPDPKHCCCC
jgi:hypothetical protein